MPEGLAVAGRVTAAGVHDDPDAPPPASADAPRGWTWNRPTKSWQPKIRGRVLWHEGQGGGPAPAAAAPAAPPPDRDPDPPWSAPEARPARKPPAEVPAKVRDDIAGFAGLVATPILALLKSADPYCGGALADSFEGVFDATLPLMLRSEKLVQYFSEDEADWLMWGKLAIALAPVGKAIVEHHVLKTVHLVRDEETGAVGVVRGNSDEAELLQPGRPDYSAFPAG